MVSNESGLIGRNLTRIGFRLFPVPCFLFPHFEEPNP
jgi:hypothetical protein